MSKGKTERAFISREKMDIRFEPFNVLWNKFMYINVLYNRAHVRKYSFPWAVIRIVDVTLEKKYLLCICRSDS